ncbi:MAG: zf-HC2 domain-containing protein, partial [Acidimicrobiales bacterium]
MLRRLFDRMGEREPDECRAQRGRVALAAIDDLAAGERVALDAHLERCESCRAELAELMAVARTLGEADPTRIRRTDPSRPRRAGGAVAAGPATH